MTLSADKNNKLPAPYILLRGNQEEWKKFISSLRLPGEYRPATSNQSQAR